MFRVLLAFLVLAAGLQTGAAQLLPKFPQQAHVASGTEVKAYWTRTLRWQCRTLRSREAIRIKKRLIEAIELGLYDDKAEITALKSNIAFYEFHQLFMASRRAKDRIAAIHERQAAIAAAAAIAIDPAAPVVQAAAGADPPAPEPEVIYLDTEWDDADCPPHDPHLGVQRPHSPHRPGLPHRPLPILPERPVISPPVIRPTPAPAPDPPKAVLVAPPSRLVPPSTTQPSVKPAPSRPASTPSPSRAPQAPSPSKTAGPMRR